MSQKRLSGRREENRFIVDSIYNILQREEPSPLLRLFSADFVWNTKRQGQKEALWHDKF